MRKKITLFLLCAAITSYAQQINGFFEDFEAGYNEVGVQPIGWNGSNVNQTVKVLFWDQTKKEQLVFAESTGYNSSNSVKMVDTFVGVGDIGSNAPAYISLGTPWVYATSKVEEADGGTYGGVDFTYKPDALRGYIKRTLGGEKNTGGSIILYSWKGKTSYTRKVSIIDNGTPQSKELVNRERDVLGMDNVATRSEDFELISKAEYPIPAENINEWQEVVIPIEYLSDNAPEKINVIISSADYFNRNNIGNGNILYADNFELLYYSELASLTYDGVSYFETGKNQYIIDKPYDISKVTYSSNGKGATIEYSYDEETAILTLIVKGNDYEVNQSNYHEYTIQFAQPQPEVTEYINDLIVNVNGISAPSQTAKIELIKELDGTNSLVLKNFILGEGEMAMPIGNIKMTNLNIVDGKIEASQTIKITEGDDPNYEGSWWGPDLGEINVDLHAEIISETELKAVIDIPDFGGMIIKVTFAGLQQLNDGEDVNLSLDLSNIQYNRKFAAGWSTICLPFATTATAFGEGAKVYEFTNADENGLDFTATEYIVENVPYLIYLENAIETPIYFGVNVTSAVPQSVKNGEYTFVGSYASSISMAGNYGVATIDGVQKIVKGGANSTLKSTRAYFVKEGVQPALVNIYFDREPTSIDNTINSVKSTFDVYTLQGVQVLKNASSIGGLKKGIYIINGKKTVIK